ncbi:hypothetical protein OUZ56_001303 [Daphnia magna]|uniref:Uncharacterized protein n=1 Tax=Daphnia magna TaxID=35525 RepID=A0ABR0A290_9CRUS|nr:hypothetical protein OUZ56_001303 [Daphnia magna]
MKPVSQYQSLASLARLRSGHHHLNSFIHRINPEADPNCRFGCEAIENARHAQKMKYTAKKSAGFAWRKN